MRGAIATAAVCTLGILALPVQANEKPSEAYTKAMQDNGAALQSLRTNIKAIEAAGAYPDYAPVEKDIATLKASFATTLAFWQAKNVADAVKLAQAGAKATADVEAAMKDKDYRGLVAASTDLSETCTACHMAHRERLPDGTSEIK